MKVQEDDKRFSRPKFLKVMIERRNKRRASSFDATIESSSSSLDASHRNGTPSTSQHNAEAPAIAAPIVIEEEDDDTDILAASLKKDIALANRVAALKAQQRMLGENHPDVLFSLQNLAALHYRRGHYEEAQQVLEEQQARSEQAQHEQPSTYTIPHEIAFSPKF